jgi:bifunctional non-homologous end joining protein LigD
VAGLTVEGKTVGVPSDALDQYRDKRDFSKTDEPEGGSPSSGQPCFVVQKHAARALHYDFRLEVDGVMPSWAVPKGPSYDPKVKRLAIHVEDHPLDYRTFEGAIPQSEYGGGAVIVWDSGTYRNATEHGGKPVPMADAISRGHLNVWLEGVKLRGGWSLTRTARPGDRQESWVMVKRKDECADPDLDITTSAPASVASGRTLEELLESRGSDDSADGARWVDPMLAHLAKAPPPSGPEWSYERKFDGLRAIAVRNGDEVELWSRGHLSYKARFAGLVDELLALPVDSFTLDGEIVAFAGERTGFELLPEAGSTATAVFVVFDVLHLLGHSTTALPLSERRRLLAALLEPGGAVRAVEPLVGEPAGLLELACRSGWEGVVAKRADSSYRSGRSRDWLKFKCEASQELVIGGFTDPEGTRSEFGALLMGYYEAGALCYAGKVGTGFDRATLLDVHGRLTALLRSSAPFADPPRYRSVHWVEPELVAEVGFAEWTPDGKLRHPRFKGLRADKQASEVRRERPE